MRRLRGAETRKAVAERAGFSAEYLRVIEEEDRVPQKDKQIALAKALGVDVRQFLERALLAENKAAHEVLTRVSPRFPRIRKLLLAKLEGSGVEVVREDLRGLALSPHERSAILVWAGVWFMDSEGVDPAEAHRLAKERVYDERFVEEVLADYVARNLVSWNVDSETGRQVHAGDSPRVEELLVQMAGHLGHLPLAGRRGNLAAALEIADLLKEEEFSALFYNLKGYQELSDQDKADIRSLWELAGRLVQERLERKTNES